MPTSSETDLLNIIKEHPYYSVQIIPDAAASKSILDIRATVKENTVSIRGWDFPHALEREVFTGDKYIFALVNWERHRELWRAYPSGQFVYLGNVWDVYPSTQAILINEVKRNVAQGSNAQIQSVAGALSFIGIIYSITEFYLFAARWISTISVPGSADVRIVLHGVEGWVLAAGDPRVPWHSFYQSRVAEITSDSKMPSIGLISDPLGKARIAIRDVFARFNWYEVADSTIAQWQDNIVKGRF